MSPDVIGRFLPIVLVVLLVFVIVIRPARKRAQQVSKLQAALSVGDEVMLTSGIFATVMSVPSENDDRVRVSVAEGVVLAVHRGAVAEIVQDVREGDLDLDENDSPADYADGSSSPESSDAPVTHAGDSGHRGPDSSAREAS